MTSYQITAWVALLLIGWGWGSLNKAYAHRMPRAAIRAHAVLGTGVLFLAAAWVASW